MTQDRSFVDLDPTFNHNLDEDFDFRASGITRSSFCNVYFDWIQFCYEKRLEAHKLKHSEKHTEQQKTKAKGESQSVHLSQAENLGSVSDKNNENKQEPTEPNEIVSKYF